jgi:hypothetical protein
MTFGATTEDDPDFCPFGPLLLDIEISARCNGVNGKLCSFCYKSNTPNGEVMSFELFRKIFYKIPKTCGQIAFGVGAHATENADTFRIMKYCRGKGIVPNLTVAQLNDRTAKEISSIAGSCAISNYDRDVCYDSVERLTNLGMRQCNIHQFTSSESFEDCKRVLRDVKTDPRLKKLNAVVFLSLKQKGRGIGFHRLSDEKFEELVNFALTNKINIGFDSCSCNKFLKIVENNPNFNNFKNSSEPCEAGCMSFYINAKGHGFPCSFSEGTSEWGNGIDILSIDSFDQVWHHPRMVAWRKELLKNNRRCPCYEI